MKIKQLKHRRAAVADGRLRSSNGFHALYALGVIVEGVATAGITGINETYDGDGPVAGLESVRSRAEGMAPAPLTGFGLSLESPAGSVAEESEVGRSQPWLAPGETLFDRNSRPFGAIEAAWLDAIGKAMAVPLGDLAVSRCQDRAPDSDAGVELDYDQVARGEARYDNRRSASVTTRPRCGSMSTRTGNAFFPVGKG